MTPLEKAKQYLEEYGEHSAAIRAVNKDYYLAASAQKEEVCRLLCQTIIRLQLIERQKTKNATAVGKAA